MSSGQKAWADECEEHARPDHRNRLTALGIEKIQSKVDELRQTVALLEGDLPAMSRTGWARLDRLKSLLRELG